VTNFTFIGATRRPCRAKTFFEPLSKNDTGMAAFRAGLPVKITAIGENHGFRDFVIFYCP